MKLTKTEVGIVTRMLMDATHEIVFASARIHEGNFQEAEARLRQAKENADRVIGIVHALSNRAGMTSP